MRIAKSLLPLAAMFLPTLAYAQAPTVPAAGPAVATGSSTQAKAKGDSKLVCRTMDATGSRLSKRRECRSATDWAEIRALDRRDIERFQANRGTAGGS